MNKSAIVGAVLGAAAVTAAAGFGTYALVDDSDDGTAQQQEQAAQQQQQATQPAQRCRETEVQKPAEVKDGKRIAGAAIGALVGGAVGRDVGDSDLTTAAGAAAGAYAGHEIEKKYQQGRTETVTEVRCQSEQ